MAWGDGAGAELLAGGVGAASPTDWVVMAGAVVAGAVVAGAGNALTSPMSSGNLRSANKLAIREWRMRMGRFDGQKVARSQWEGTPRVWILGVALGSPVSRAW